MMTYEKFMEVADPSLEGALLGGALGGLVEFVATGVDFVENPDGDKFKELAGTALALFVAGWSISEMIGGSYTDKIIAAEFVLHGYGFLKAMLSGDFIKSPYFLGTGIGLVAGESLNLIGRTVDRTGGLMHGFHLPSIETVRNGVGNGLGKLANDVRMISSNYH